MLLSLQNDAFRGCACTISLLSIFVVLLVSMTLGLNHVHNQQVLVSPMLLNDSQYYYFYCALSYRNCIFNRNWIRRTIKDAEVIQYHEQCCYIIYKLYHLVSVKVDQADERSKGVILLAENDKSTE